MKGGWKQQRDPHLHDKNLLSDGNYQQAGGISEKLLFLPTTQRQMFQNNNMIYRITPLYYSYYIISKQNYL